jgi:hypothetical protein
VDQVRVVLLERDEALLKARENLAAMRIVAAEWETEVASTRVQLKQDCATLEGARSWQSQAKEKAKEAEQLRVELADKATALTRRRGSSSRSRVRASRRMLGFSRSDTPSRRPKLPSSVNAWSRRRRMANSSGSVLRSRRHGPPSSSGTGRSRGSTGS